MNCDPIARWYRIFEYLTFAGALQRRRLEYVNQTTQPRSVLILGDGDGRFTAEFVSRNPQSAVESIDASPKMLALAKSRVSAANRIQFRTGDARAINLLGTYDLIVTHFFLDCFTDAELEGLVSRVSACCNPNAHWIVSEFALPSAGVKRLAASALIRVMYFFFRIVTGLKVTHLPDYLPILKRHGFRLARHRSAAGGLLVSQLWELITEPATQP